MKRKLKAALIGSVVFSILSTVAMAAPNPATQDWVVTQLNTLSATLTQLITGNSGALTVQNWNAICTTGSPANSAGCFGNLSSAAFANVNTAIGPYTTLANIPVTDLANSVFVKQFFAGANVPLSGTQIAVSTDTATAVCGLFTVTGTSLGDGGVINSAPNNSYYPYGQFFESIASSATINVQYYGGTAGEMVTSAPIYLLCLGYAHTTGNPTVAAALGNITAV